VEQVDMKRLRDVLSGDFGRFVKAEQLAVAALRQAIISGVLPPGQAIDEEVIAGLLDLSRMPVRQAMGVLESEGLVKRVYKRGVTVTELTSSEIEEIYTIRATLESLAIRKAVPAYTDEHLEAVHTVLVSIREHDQDIEEFSQLNQQFHTMLYEPSEWDTLNAMIVRLRNNVARYIAISHHFLQQLPFVRADHDRIFAACLARDADAAADLTQEHIFNAMRILLESFELDVWTNGEVAAARSGN
jgi:DNA-binding GntR family transcriptional regulator